MGSPGARHWRQVWSDHRLKGPPRAPQAVHALAHAVHDPTAGQR
jgi:tRNA-dihydrouridine synthase A